MNALMKKSVSVFIPILKNLFFNRALTLSRKMRKFVNYLLRKRHTHCNVSYNCEEFTDVLRAMD